MFSSSEKRTCSVTPVYSDVTEGILLFKPARAALEIGSGCELIRFPSANRNTPAPSSSDRTILHSFEIQIFSFNINLTMNLMCRWVGGWLCVSGCGWVCVNGCEIKVCIQDIKWIFFTLTSGVMRRNPFHSAFFVSFFWSRPSRLHYPAAIGQAANRVLAIFFSLIKFSLSSKIEFMLWVGIFFRYQGKQPLAVQCFSTKPLILWE